MPLLLRVYSSLYHRKRKSRKIIQRIKFFGLNYFSCIPLQSDRTSQQRYKKTGYGEFGLAELIPQSSDRWSGGFTQGNPTNFPHPQHLTLTYVGSSGRRQQQGRGLMTPIKIHPLLSPRQRYTRRRTHIYIPGIRDRVAPCEMGQAITNKKIRNTLDYFRIPSNLRLFGMHKVRDEQGVFFPWKKPFNQMCKHLNCITRIFVSHYKILEQIKRRE